MASADKKEAPAAPIAGGWVFKQKKLNGWNKRWAIMYGTKMTWFDTPNTSGTVTEVGYLDVTGCECLPVASDKATKRKFQIENKSKGTTTVFYVESDAARNQWVNGIRAIVKGTDIGQLKEKPKMVNSDGQILDADEVKKLVKKGQTQGMSVQTAPKPGERPTSTPGFNRTPGATPNAPFQRSPYQIDFLASPPARTSAILGKQLSWEAEERKRDDVCGKLAKDRNEANLGDIDSNEDDWLVDDEPQGLLSGGCQQQ